MSSNDRPWRPWWPVYMMGSAAALLAAVAFTFTTINFAQRIDELNDTVDVHDEQDVCRQRFYAALDAAALKTRGYEHAVLAAQIGGYDATGAAEAVAAAEKEYRRLVDLQSDWASDDMALPCPIDAIAHS